LSRAPDTRFLVRISRTTDCNCMNASSSVNPSPPLLTGRRLPLLPVSLICRYPTMSLQPQSVSKPQDHTLCFIDGMTDSMMGRSAFEDSYYEEDGINGNPHMKPRRCKKVAGVSSCTTSDSLNPTHRVQSAFIPRHSDEVLLDIGDAVHVDRTCEDHWCYGTNLRTGMTGIFPSAVVCEIDIVEEICLGALPSNATSEFSQWGPWLIHDFKIGSNQANHSFHFWEATN
uniref:SH3 domain-containing protein n=1 Tax=Heligmosomoides polygyrus TaxID=6339 RepID=A0A183GCN0_HELPZ